MMRRRAVAIGGALALALAAASVSSAFAGGGHGATTVEAVAKRARISKRTF